MTNAEITEQIRNAVDVDRLTQTAVSLIEVPSPTGSAAAVSDRLAELLTSDGFAVERPEAGWAESRAVVARLQGGSDGPTIQFNGHLDTVHLPYVAPGIEEGVLTGSGASDMKGGIAAMVEAMRALRDCEALPTGGVLLTAHDLHEAPWGDGTQVEGLIDAGYVGDAVLLPEYLCDRVPLCGRGMAIFEVRIKREGNPVHEVLGGIEHPNVIHAGADLICQLRDQDVKLAELTHPLAGRESTFVGKMAAGEIFNGSPVECELSGTRRWLPGNNGSQTAAEFQMMLDNVSDRYGVTAAADYNIIRESYEIEESNPLVTAFQSAYAAVSGEPLPVGAKPFCDDGNEFISRGGIPALTHGPNATGAHTIDERVSIDELVRVATVYALTAIEFCRG